MHSVCWHPPEWSRNHGILASRTLKTVILPTSTALECPLTGMNPSASHFLASLTNTDIEQDLAKHFLPFHAVSTKICRDAPSGVSKEVGFARYVRVSSIMTLMLIYAGSKLETLLSVSSRSTTVCSLNMMGSSSSFALPTPRLRSSLNSKVKNVAIGEAASTAIQLNILPLQH